MVTAPPMAFANVVCPAVISTGPPTAPSAMSPLFEPALPACSLALPPSRAVRLLPGSESPPVPPYRSRVPPKPPLYAALGIPPCPALIVMSPPLPAASPASASPPLPALIVISPPSLSDMVLFLPCIVISSPDNILISALLSALVIEIVDADSIPVAVPPRTLAPVLSKIPPPAGKTMLPSAPNL